MMGEGFMNEGMGYGAGLFGILWMVLILLFIASFIYIVIRLFQSNRIGDKKQKTKDDAIEILKKRYVKGEITEEEYLSMKKILTS